MSLLASSASEMFLAAITVAVNLSLTWKPTGSGQQLNSLFVRSSISRSVNTSRATRSIYGSLIGMKHPLKKENFSRCHLCIFLIPLKDLFLLQAFQAQMLKLFP